MSRAALLQAAKDSGHLVIVRVPEQRVKSLREACIERGVNPDATGYAVPKQRLLAVDRIIPGIADSTSPGMAKTEAARRGNARRQYTRQSAANDAGQIADGGTVAYVAAFCRLNNLTS